MSLQMKLWKRLKQMKIIKAEKIHDAAVYKEKLDIAKTKVVEFMVSDIQKQMQAHLANKFKNLNTAPAKAKKPKKLVAPIGNKLKSMVKNKRGLLDTIVEEGSMADLEPITPLPKKVPGRKASKVGDGTPIQAQDSITDSGLFELAKQRQK